MRTIPKRFGRMAPDSHTPSPEEVLQVVAGKLMDGNRRHPTPLLENVRLDRPTGEGPFRWFVRGDIKGTPYTINVSWTVKDPLDEYTYLCSAPLRVQAHGFWDYVPLEYFGTPVLAVTLHGPGVTDPRSLNESTILTADLRDAIYAVHKLVYLADPAHPSVRYHRKRAAGVTVGERQVLEAMGGSTRWLSR